MNKVKYFKEQFSNDPEAMYKEQKDLGKMKFSEKWWMTRDTIRKYMPNKERVLPTKEEILYLMWEWNSEKDVRLNLDISLREFSSILGNWYPYKLSKEDRKAIRESDKSNEDLAEIYKVPKSIIEKNRLTPVRDIEITIKKEEIKLNVWKWDRSEKEPYWKNIWEIKTRWAASFIKFNTPLCINERS